MISLIHPSRSRPQKAYDALTRFWQNYMRGHHFEHILSLDEDDPEIDNYRELFPDGYDVIVNKNRSAIDAINNAAKVATGDILLVMSDDTDCPKEWIKIILELTEGKNDFVIKFGDGIQKRIITMPVMDRTYYNRDGYIYNPIYSHSFADTELTEVAHLRGRVIDARHIMFKHLHYSVTGEQPDELYKRNDATHDPGRKVFQERQRINFGL